MRIMSRRAVKRTVFIAIAIILLLSISLGSVYIVAAVNHKNYLKEMESLPFNYGTVDFSNWSSEDQFNADSYNSINAIGEAKILIFTDIHFGYIYDLSSKLGIYKKQDEKILKNISDAVDKQKPDMLLFLGDVIVGDDSAADMKIFGEAIDKLGAPWAFVFGNHEGDGSLYQKPMDYGLRADKAKLAEILSTFDNCLYRNGYSVKYEDGLYSIGNDMIRVMIDGVNVYNLFTLDSHSYIPPEYEYDSIRSQQVAWYDWASKNSNTENMVFAHMPISQYTNAYNSIGKKLHGTQPVDNGLFNKMKTNKGTDIFAGHLHGQNKDILYDGVNFHFALTSSTKALQGKAGYKSIVITKDGKTSVSKNYF